MRLEICLLLAGLVAAGCDQPCPVRETRHETVEVMANDRNRHLFPPCVDSNNCLELCTATAMARVALYVIVDECMRVDQDGGAGNEDGGADASGTDGGQQVQQVTLEMTYRVFACGT